MIKFIYIYIICILLLLKTNSQNILLYGVSTPQYDKEFMNYTLSRLQYSRKHGYTYDIPTLSSLDSNHHPTAFRMYKAYNYLIGNYSIENNTKHHDWIVYLDADIFIAEQSIPIKVLLDAANKFSHQESECHFIAQDGGIVVNSGFWIVRNSTQGKMFIQNWIAEFEKAEKTYGIHVWLEDQGALSQMILHYVASIKNNSYHSDDCMQRAHRANLCYNKKMASMGAPYMQRKVGNLCIIPPIGVPYQFHVHSMHTPGELVYHRKRVNSSIVNSPGFLDYSGTHIIIKNGSYVRFSVTNNYLLL